jgi:hypothetical protein
MNAEIEKLKEKLFFLSLEKETKQQKYIEKMEEKHNQLTGQVYQMSYNLKQKQMQNLKEKQQIIYAITATAKQSNLKALFLTWTCSSPFHPFIINYKINKIVRKNPKFAYKSVDEAIKPAYLKLKKSFRDFYYQIKKLDKKMMYIKVYEPHKTLIPHLHCLLFVSPEHQNQIKKIFYKTVENNNLKRVDFDESLFVDNIRKPQAYIMKYLFKTILAEDDFMVRWLDGWRRKYQIRIIETTQLPMSLEVYRSIYYSLNEQDKKEIDDIILNENNKYDNFYDYFIDNSDIDIQIVDEDENLISHKQINKGIKTKIL